MKKTLKLINLGSLCLLATFLFTSTVQNDWEILGEKKINLSLEADEIIVGAKDGRFTAIKFKILDEGIFLHNIKITYGNGESDLKVIKQKLKAGSESKVVDLPGNKRIIKKIRFLYKTRKKAKRRATIVALGK